MYCPGGLSQTDITWHISSWTVFYIDGNRKRGLHIIREVLTVLSVVIIGRKWPA
jgi:hypothetical protein